MEARDTLGDLKRLIEHVAEVFNGLPALHKESYALGEIASTVDGPFTLAVFGRMKTGKSSIINALVGRNLAITGVEEATATVNWISHGDKAQEDSVLVHWKDGKTEPVPFVRISDWAGKSPEVLKRVADTAFLQLYADIPLLKNINIVDTPGTGSVADEHEETALEFLSPRAALDTEQEGRKADALLYVFPAVARASDQDLLSNFAQSRMPGSDPYNSLGVLHKWDGLAAGNVREEARNKARVLADHMRNIVSDVIPVSAPLAMAARSAPDAFFEGIVDLTSTAESRDVILKALRRDNRWDADEQRMRIRKSYPLPWVSFVRLVHLMIEHSCRSAAEARKVCLEESGFPELERTLDGRFFKRAALIKQRLTRVKAMHPIQDGIMGINARLRMLKDDQNHFAELLVRTPDSDRHHAWLSRKHREAAMDHERLEKEATALDQRWLTEKEAMRKAENDLAFLEAMDHHPGWIEERDRDSIRVILTVKGTDKGDQLPTRIVLESLIARYAPMMHSPVKSERDHFEHLLARIYEALHS